ncbi:hypothetical protein RclHR1_19630001 [Rhizophagus clarus]|uniref:K Homology domain-containing protein n=1 Tax=Rhizophagus clarus TaxID=94130 RepID=A0A2Z6QPX2_9GLOM|nr:hypothetical protein RclHR1_19630001 [Rhizophagus clarus]
MQKSKQTNKKLSIPIPQNIVISKLVGRKGCNLKPIVEKTGTHIYVNSKESPAKIEVRINEKKEIPLFDNRINDAFNRLTDLMNKISKQGNKKVDKVKKSKKERKGKKEKKKALKKVESERSLKEV